METPKLTKDEILAIKNELPRGAMKEIAENIGVTRQYVSQVLNNITPYNYQVIKAALDYVERVKIEGMAIREQFKKLTKSA